MTHTFHKLLLSELHMVVCQPGDPAGVTNQMLCEAVTVNENLVSLGFVLKADDIVRLAASPSRYRFFTHVKELVPEVKAQPMYPGFPQQVLEMSEAQFRLHQLMHYFSTYGMERLLGVEVHRGWLPAYDGPQRTEEDTRLLEEKVIELVAENDAPFRVLSILLNRRERLTNPELALVVEAATVCTAEQMQGLTVRFKENLELLFPLLMELEDRAVALRTLRCICAHSGDVLRCAANYLSRKRYHLRTSEKKLLVKLLESYDVRNFRTNLMQSLRLRERNLRILRHLDYNQYSRSPEHREAVRALRGGELLSWHGIGEALLKERSPRALGYLAQRPGYMVRMLNRLLSLGYEDSDIADALLPHAGQISGHLLIRCIRTLANMEGSLERKYRDAVRLCEDQFQREVWWLNNPLQLYHREVEQIRSAARCQRGEAEYRLLRLPVPRAEETIYQSVWKMEEELEQAEIALEKLQDHLSDLELSEKDASYVRNAHLDFDPDAVLFRMVPEHFARQRQQLQQRLDILREDVLLARKAADERFEAEKARIEAENAPRYAQELQRIDAREQQELEQLQSQYQTRLEQHDQLFAELQERKQRTLAQLEEQHQLQIHVCRFAPRSAQILKSLLKEHFRLADTPLKGKKVFCSMDAFDLTHSTLDTEDRSKDGGYIRSGISWKIPEDARYVRFFVYWNDSNRVDIDLHAGGRTTDGESLHVGWNANFRNCGVVHSGDITHSDAAEYIDIDLSKPIQEIYANINLFTGRPSFREIETCYVGMMAVKNIGETVKHYSPRNCFFTHELTQKAYNLFYGFVDVQNRCVRFVGKPNQNWSDWSSRPPLEDLFCLQDYLDILLDGQQVQIVDSAEDADVVLTMGKGLEENSLSLVDHNFFLEC